MFARGSAHFLSNYRHSADTRRIRIAQQARRPEAPKQLLLWTIFPAFPTQLALRPIRVERRDH